MVYTITCNPSLDYTLKVPNLTTDSIHRSTEENITVGGKGINVSVIVSRLGIPTCAMGFVGGFTGKQLQALLCAEGIACDFTELPQGETRINVKLRSQTECDINARGPIVTEADIKNLLTRIEKLTENDVLVLAGSTPIGTTNDVYERILEHAHGALSVVDAENDLLRRALRFHPFLIKPNHHELGALFNTKVSSEEEIVPLARELQAEGARNVLVSRAENGALLLDETGCVHTVNTVNGTLRNSVGCGDSMVAGFIAGWLQTQDYAAALRLGAACGNATAFSDTLATRAEIDALLPHVTAQRWV